MAATTQAASRPTRRRSGRRQQTLLTKLIRGVLGAVGVTLACILLFAFMMQWLKPSDGVIRVVNQLIKLAAIFVGVRLAVGTGGERGLLTGALVGFLYMLLGVVLYALLSGQQLPLTSYLSDIAMGVAGGGIAGALFSRGSWFHSSSAALIAFFQSSGCVFFVLFFVPPR